MAIKKVNGHAVTGVFPTGSADLTVVGHAPVKFPDSPQSKSGPAVKLSAK